MPVDAAFDPELDANLPATDGRLFVNGVSAATGGYALGPLSTRTIIDVAKGAELSEAEKAELPLLSQPAAFSAFRGEEAVDPFSLEGGGWGIIFGPDVSQDVKDALAPLAELRRSQTKGHYHLFDGPTGFRAGDDKIAFLARSGVGPGPLRTDKVPYYLLVVGGPESIPFEFQYELDVQYAVGRLAFDSVDAYARYAEGVVAAESAAPRARPQRAAFFGTRNPGDPATRLSATQLIATLASDFPTAKTVVGRDATKTNLIRLLGGPDTPGLLLTATHGLDFPSADARQRATQGALVCQEWNPFAGAISPDQYLCAADVPDDADVSGLIAFHFACYGGGTPLEDDFGPPGTPRRLTESPFVAALPQRLLSHPKGPALAVVAHVERAWGYSFSWPGVQDDAGCFHDFVDAVLAGGSIGLAMNAFGQRFAGLAVSVDGMVEQTRRNHPPDPDVMAGRWVAKNDARNYVLLGDPAVRLRT